MHLRDGGKKLPLFYCNAANIALFILFNYRNKSIENKLFIVLV